MALDSRARRELALALKSQGLDEEAEDQFRLVLRTAPFEHWEWNDAAEQWAIAWRRIRLPKPPIGCSMRSSTTCVGTTTC